MSATSVDDWFPFPQFLFVNHFPIYQSREVPTNEAESHREHLVREDPERREACHQFVTGCETQNINICRNERDLPPC